MLAFASFGKRTFPLRGGGRFLQNTGYVLIGVWSLVVLLRPTDNLTEDRTMSNTRSLIDQLAELQKMATVLPEIKKEIKGIESCLDNLKKILGEEPAKAKGKQAKAAPKSKSRRKKATKRMGMKEKILGALKGKKGGLTAAELAEQDGRATAATLTKWVQEGILKKEKRGRYAKA